MTAQVQNDFYGLLLLGLQFQRFIKSIHHVLMSTVHAYHQYHPQVIFRGLSLLNLLS